MAAILLKDQQISQSKTHAESALLAYEKLSDKYAQNMQYLASLSQTEILLARIHLAENNPVESQRYCQSVVDRLAPLIEQNKDPRFSLPYVIALDCLGQLTQHPDLLALMQHAGISDINFTRSQ